MVAKVLMVQGTASSVGKSLLVTAFCRLFRQEGYDVAPFKAQNMSLNSYVTPDGGEIGRAQAVQAEAAMVEPSVDMNPILLKPEADARSQVVVMGKSRGSYPAREYYQWKKQLWPIVAQSLDRLRHEYEVVVIEGAGSPAEINLREQDLVNMSVAKHCEAPVLLVGDIERGGVFASLVGTLQLLEPDERALIKGLVINKFRGDISLLKPGIRMLEERAGVPVLGVIPYLSHLRIPDEDSVSLETRKTRPEASSVLNIAVIRLAHISNFDDFNPLEDEPCVHLYYVNEKDSLGQPDLIILPGSKTTAADLASIRQEGLASKIVALAKQSTPVIGICGGYQMLGQRLLDPQGLDSDQKTADGLGLLPVTTLFQAPKETHRVSGEVTGARGLLEGATGLSFQGYEIHLGRTYGEGITTPLRITERSGQRWDAPDGGTDVKGMVLGTYVHGLFHNDEFRHQLLKNLARRKGIDTPTFNTLGRQDVFDRLADAVRQSLDMETVYRLVGLKGA